MTIGGSNVSALTANQTYLNANANNVANVNTDRYVPTQTTLQEGANGSVQANLQKANDTGATQSQTNLAKEVTDQIAIENTTAANVQAMQTKDAMMGSLLDIKV